MTSEQAFDFLITFYRMEVERNNCVFEQTDRIVENILKIAHYLTGKSKKEWLYLCGRVGNGKTTILTCISKLYGYLTSEGYIDSESGFETVSAVDLSLYIIDNRELFEKYKTCKMLIIDDLGEEAKEIPMYGVNRMPVIEVLMYRYKHRLVTITSSNLNASLLKEKYADDRLSDRMKEMFNVVTFDDKSFR